MSDDKYKSVFADNLNKLMRIKGITQTDIINDLKINKSTISTWCNGSRLPRSFRDVLFWIALKLDADNLPKSLGFRDVLFWIALKQLIY